jgi:hypothetical protein
MKELAMKRSIRLAVMAGLALAFAGVSTVVLAQEEGENGRAAKVETCAEGKPSDPCTDIEPGAASMEPAQALEDPASVEQSEAHKKWLEEIWNSP